MDAITARQNVRICASQQGQYGAAVGVQIDIDVYATGGGAATYLLSLTAT